MSAERDPPLVAGVIHGLRTWSLDIRAGEPRLGSPMAPDYVWEADGLATTAECETHGRDSPRPNCGCGLYAHHPRGRWADLALEHRHGRPGACGGIVAAWGRVEVHRDGFRAQHARPVALFLRASERGTEYEQTVRALAHRHGAEVLVVDDAGAVLAYCRRNELGLDRGAVSRLLKDAGEPEAEDEPGAAPAPRRPGPLRALTAVAQAVVLGVIGIMVLAWYLAWAAAAVVIVLAMVGVVGDGEPPAGPGPTPALEVLDTRMAEFRDGLVYVTRVENTSEARAMVRVRLGGRLRGPDGETVARLHGRATEQLRPTIPPGATGAVVGWVERTPGREEALEHGTRGLRLDRARARAPRTPAAAGFPDLELASARVEGGPCVLSARVSSARPLRSVRVTAIAFAGDRPVDLLTGLAGPLTPRPRRQALARVPPESCMEAGRRAERIEVYPNPTRGQLRAGTPRARRE